MHVLDSCVMNEYVCHTFEKYDIQIYIYPLTTIMHAHTFLPFL